jgi:ATP-dependent Clp protease ATP-binding subunit ClpA
VAQGARRLKRAIEEEIAMPLSDEWHEGRAFDVQLVNGRVGIVNVDSLIRVPPQGSPRSSKGPQAV